MDGEPSGLTDVKYYLSCFPAPPMALRRDRATTIGRAEGNTIVLADSTVSRTHAVVEWKDGDYVVRDAGSRNGVFLNGERVAEAPLRSDDEIAIGDRVFTFLVGEERAVSQHFVQQRRRRQCGGTDVIEAASLRRAAGGFSGHLEDFDLAELLQALGLGSKTGRVRVACDDVHGDIYLREGQVVKGSLGDLSSEDAVYALLSLKHGTFEFDAGPVDVEADVRASTASLLMEALRRVDEERRARAEAGEPAGVDADTAKAEPHDPALDTKHGEEPPPEVAAAERGRTMSVEGRPSDADAATGPERAAPAPDADEDAGPDAEPSDSGPAESDDAPAPPGPDDDADPAPE